LAPKYLLDTNACISYLNYPGSAIFQSIRSVPSDEITVCSVVKAELFFGSMSSQNPTRNLPIQNRFLRNFVSFAFDDKAAERYAEIRAHLSSIGKLIGPYDMLIASIALANHLTLVSNNLREFSRVPGLNLEDWQ
jgi:tRNA(fMet)-specific endonuclease VapC